MFSFVTFVCQKLINVFPRPHLLYSFLFLTLYTDPFNWSVTDVQKWLLWMQRWVQLPSLKLELFAMDGMALCSLSEEDFRQRVPNGEKLYAKLEIWRMAINYFKPEAIFDTLFGSLSDSEGAADSVQEYCPSPYASSTTADNCSIYSASSSSPIRSPETGYIGGGSSLPSYAESMYGGQCSTSGSIASPASPASSSHSSVNSCTPYAVQYNGNSGQQGFGQQQPQMYGGKAIQVNDFSSLNNAGANMMNTSAQQHRMVATSDYGSDAIPSDGKFWFFILLTVFIPFLSIL